MIRKIDGLSIGIICWLVWFPAFGQNQYINYTVDQGLSNNHIHCITEDKYGFLWIGTEEGLNRFDGENFQHFEPAINDSKSISGRVISEILADSLGLWIALGDNGLSFYDFDTEFFRDIAQPTGPAYINCMLKDNNGNLLFGSSNGAYMVDKSFELHSRSDRKANITSITVGDDGTIFIASIADLIAIKPNGESRAFDQ